MPIHLSAGNTKAFKRPAMDLTSTAFKEGAPIPSEYTCEGANISPPLAFGRVPAIARSLALIMEDPDAPAGLWTHWLVWNIPPGTDAISRGERIRYIQGTTSARSVGYHGPGPPRGPHEFFFRLFALDTVLELKAHGRGKELESAMQGHVIDRAELMGTYERR
jgi:Raf kinase inhibitor-like YbhB/YbcL family protein